MKQNQPSVGPRRIKRTLTIKEHMTKAGPKTSDNLSCRQYKATDNKEATINNNSYNEPTTKKMQKPQECSNKISKKVKSH